MRNVTILLAVVVMSTLTGPAWGYPDYHWIATSGDWSDGGNWDSGAKPGGWTANAYIDNGGTATITGSESAYYMYIGHSDGAGTGTGVVQQTGNTEFYTSCGAYIGSNGRAGTFTQNGSCYAKLSVYADHGVEIGGRGGSGLYALSSTGQNVGGTYYALYVRGDMVLDVDGTGSGTWRITTTDVGKITLKASLILGGDTTTLANNDVTITAAEGENPEDTVPIHMTGSEFTNRCINETKLAGLNNITFVFEGGAGTDDFEVGGEDLGAVEAGLNLNFALEGLILGGGNVGNLRLVDTYDNQADGQGVKEALYVENLILNDGSTLYTNGLNLYYLNGTLDPGATVDTTGGGGIYLIPEPATMVLLGIGGLGVLIRRRRK